jgi:RHS repeat-associated protein
MSAALSATTASVTAQQLYGPYGVGRYASGSMPTAKGYTGQYTDAASSGLDDYQARPYDAVLGQFASAESAAAGGLNRYASVHGNPETATDPTGHRCTVDTCAGGGGTGGCGTTCGDGHPGHAGCGDTCGCDKSCRRPPPPGGCKTNCGSKGGGNARTYPGSGSDGCRNDASCGCYATCLGCPPLDYACEAHQYAINQERDLSKYRNILSGFGGLAALIRGALEGAKGKISLIIAVASYLAGAAGAAAVLSWIMWTILNTEIQDHPDDSWYTEQNISQFFGGPTGAFVIYGAVDAVLFGAGLAGVALSGALTPYATLFAGGVLVGSLTMSIPGEIALATDEGDQVRPYTAS